MINQSTARVNGSLPTAAQTVPAVGATTSSRAPATTHDQQGTLQETSEKKKKCHGQRKKQRYRRQLYAQGVNSATVNRLVDERFSTTAPVQESDTLDFNPSIPLDRVGFFRIPVCVSIGT